MPRLFDEEPAGSVPWPRVLPPPQPAEIRAILAARRVAQRHGLLHLPLEETLLHLRAAYAIRHGVRGYITAMVGRLARLPVRRFALFTDLDGQDRVPVEAEALMSLADYLGGCDYRQLPRRIDFVDGRDGDAASFYL